MQSHGLSTKLADRANDAGIDFIAQHADDDGKRRLIGHAPAVEFLGREPGGRHRPIDRFAPAVHEHRVQADRFHEDDVL